MKQSISVSLISMAVLFGTISGCDRAHRSENEAKESPITLSLNAYSFYDVLSAKSKRDGHQVYTFFNLLDWCASQDIRALDATAYFFPEYPKVPSDDYLKKFKAKAASLNIAFSGTGIRNDFASPDSAVRAAGVQLAKEWIIVAEKLEIPVIRLFAGKIPEGYEDRWDEVAAWMIDCYKECAVFGAVHGVKIGIQNHGGMLQTAEQCLKILKAVDSDWVGMIVDIGNFKTPDPYKDIEIMAPYAINWQIKETVFEIGSPIKTDFDRIAKILTNSGYMGYVPVETILVRGQFYDPFAFVPAMMDSMQMALDRQRLSESGQ